MDEHIPTLAILNRPTVLHPLLRYHLTLWLNAQGYGTQALDDYLGDLIALYNHENLEGLVQKGIDVAEDHLQEARSNIGAVLQGLNHCPGDSDEAVELRAFQMLYYVYMDMILGTLAGFRNMLRLIRQFKEAGEDSFVIWLMGVDDV